MTHPQLQSCMHMGATQPCRYWRWTFVLAACALRPACTVPILAARPSLPLCLPPSPSDGGPGLPCPVRHSPRLSISISSLRCLATASFLDVLGHQSVLLLLPPSVYNPPPPPPTLRALSGSPSTCAPVWVCPSIHPSIHPSIRLSVCLSVRPSVCLPASVCPSIRVCVCVCVCVAVGLPAWSRRSQLSRCTTPKFTALFPSFMFLVSISCPVHPSNRPACPDASLTPVCQAVPSEQLPACLPDTSRSGPSPAATEGAAMKILCRPASACSSSLTVGALLQRNDCRQRQLEPAVARLRIQANTAQERAGAPVQVTSLGTGAAAATAAPLVRVEPGADTAPVALSPCLTTTGKLCWPTRTDGKQCRYRHATWCWRPLPVVMAPAVYRSALMPSMDRQTHDIRLPDEAMPVKNRCFSQGGRRKGGEGSGKTLPRKSPRGGGGGTT